MDQTQYEQELAERQRKHLENLDRGSEWRPCLHDQCPKCHGTGRSLQGVCVHGLSCSCPKCSPR